MCFDYFPIETEGGAFITNFLAFLNGSHLLLKSHLMKKTKLHDRERYTLLDNRIVDRIFCLCVLITFLLIYEKLTPSYTHGCRLILLLSNSCHFVSGQWAGRNESRRPIPQNNRKVRAGKHFRKISTKILLSKFKLNSK
jgi:hypothetical protein